jgi:hypothetical protein
MEAAKQPAGTGVQKGNKMIKNRMRGLAAGIALAVVAATSQTAHAERFEGFGQGIPLESAARQIVPSDVKVDYGDGVDAKTAITFSSAADWQSALSQAVAKKGLKAEIGKDSVTIVKAPKSEVRPYSSAPSKPNSTRKNTHNAHRTPAEDLGPRVVADTPASVAPEGSTGAVPAPAGVTQQGGGGFVIRQSSGPAPVAAPAPARAASAAPVTGHGMDGKEFASKEWKPVSSGNIGSGKFIVVPGYDLRATLESWAAATGWTVNWQSEFKYQIEANATFQGDFLKATSDLIQAMSDARPTITVDFYAANHVVVISNHLADEVN